jgi:predicted O-linked N-acetylglucosamine transferase (SPINDLY family)
VALGLDAGRRADLRGRVQAAVDDSPLFDARRSARRLEAVYERLWRWHLEGRAPVASVVP